MITGFDIAQCWAIYWSVYWILGTSLTFHNEKERPPEKLEKVVSTLFVNMIWTIFGCYIISICPIRFFQDYNVPVKILVMYIATDIAFYHVHRAMHWYKWYRYLHKQHHEFRYSYALVAMYCSPWEAVVLNLWCTSLWPMIVQLPAPYLQLWFFLLSVNSVISHSGLNFYGLHYDYHHIYYKYNYGISYYLDWLYGTLY